MSSASASASTSALLIRRLYRSILKAAKPFGDASESSLTTTTAIDRNKAKVLTCLLHRTGYEDESWASFLRDASDNDDADDLDFDMEDDEDMQQPQRILFRTLLREVVAGESIRQMQWPHAVDLTLLRSIIRREFRNSSESKSAPHTPVVRQKVAFMTLTALNQKLAWYEALQADAPSVRHGQAAAFVSTLPMNPPSSYLRPGAYLIAHPHLSGYFRRTVVCLLDHKQEQETVPGSYGTYGLIVNRTRLSPQTQKSLTLEEVLRPLPEELASSFGGCDVKEGGPVHMSLQMLHSLTADQEELQIGGSPIAMMPSHDETTASSSSNASAMLSSSPSLLSDRAVYYKGDIVTAAHAVQSGSLDRQDVTFFVGATAWQPGQLESEIERGYWLPCRGPPEIAHSGSCIHEPLAEGEPRPVADLWLSMLSACGEAEAELAHLLSVDNGESELGRACDDDY